MRINRFLALAGLGSRRGVEVLVREGRVALGGPEGRVVVERLATEVDPESAEVYVDGERVRPRQPRTVVLNKPVGVLTTKQDPQGRPTVMDLLPPAYGDLAPVGRLDKDTSGLLLLTNQGELAQRCAHPRHGLTKVYVAQAVGEPRAEELKRLTRGLTDQGERLKAKSVRVLGRKGKSLRLEVVMAQGRNREVRRLLERAGLGVAALERVAVGPITGKGLGVGRWRLLKPAEVAGLEAAAGRGGKRR